jgi:hypothetical protein
LPEALAARKMPAKGPRAEGAMEEEAENSIRLRGTHTKEAVRTVVPKT